MSDKEIPVGTTVTPADGDKILVGDASDSFRLKDVLVSGLKSHFLVPFVFTAVTIDVDDTTPDVSGGNVFTTQANSGATAISDLDNPTVGQIIILIGGSNTNSSTIADSGNFNLSAAWTASLDDVLVLYVQADNDYIEICRSDN